MTYVALCFLSTYVSVFALGLQSLNVNQGHYWAAAGTSLLIGGGHIALYRYMPSASLPELIGYLAGGVTGITSSMWFHRRVRVWWATRKEARKAPTARPTYGHCSACGLPAVSKCKRLVCERGLMDEHADISSPRLH